MYKIDFTDSEISSRWGYSDLDAMKDSASLKVQGTKKKLKDTSTDSKENLLISRFVGLF